MRRSRLLLLVAAALAAVLAGCSISELTLEETSLGGPRSSREPTLPDVDPDRAVDVALEDLRVYWAEEFPRRYGGEFRDLAGFVPYGPGSDVPQCGPDQLSYDDVAGNAFYCLEEDYVAWDRIGLIPDLAERFGPLTVGVVMAHEFAHAVQTRADVRGDTVTLELQADCFAGAWAADASQRIDLFATDDGILDQAIGGFLELRDTVGADARDPNAHGSGFDRVSAFQDGYDRGGETCVGFEDDPPPVVAIPFLSVEDLQSEGNLPIDQLVDLLLADLESFFADLVERQGGEWDRIDGLVPVDPTTDVVECGDETLEGEDLRLASFFCVPDDTIYIDNVELVPALDQIGDFAFGGEIARQYAFAAQSRLGIAGGNEDTELHADCLTGAYSAAEFNGEIPGDQQLALSPGDLDEVLIAFLAFGGGESTAFERTAAFRAGFLDGHDACEPLLD